MASRRYFLTSLLPLVALSSLLLHGEMLNGLILIKCPSHQNSRSRLNQASSIAGAAGQDFHGH